MLLFFSQCNNGVNIDNRLTEKGLETRQIYQGIDVTMELERALRWYDEIALPAQYLLKCCELVKQRAKLIKLPRHPFSRGI